LLRHDGCRLTSSGSLKLEAGCAGDSLQRDAVQSGGSAGLAAGS
jgi:hypothetical protein